MFEENGRQIIFLRCSGKRVTDGISVADIRRPHRRDAVELSRVIRNRWAKQPDRIGTTSNARMSEGKQRMFRSVQAPCVVAKL